MTWKNSNLADNSPMQTPDWTPAPTATGSSCSGHLTYAQAASKAQPELQDLNARGSWKIPNQQDMRRRLEQRGCWAAMPQSA